MSETPPMTSITSSWVDLSHEVSSGLYTTSSAVPGVAGQETAGGGYGSHSSHASLRTTPVPFGSDQDYMRMLREAQKETSCRSSARVSPLTSALVSERSSPCMSPKSPPNSPRTEIADYTAQFRDVFINHMKESDTTLTDFMWDWSSTPCPPKDWKSDWKCYNQSSNNSSSKSSKSSSSKLSRFYTFLLSNLVSLLLGAGIGAWFYRRSAGNINA
jgi:BCL2/adenovirus E1B protein-interacting protein 3